MNPHVPIIWFSYQELAHLFSLIWVYILLKYVSLCFLVYLLLVHFKVNVSLHYSHFDIHVFKILIFSYVTTIPFSHSHTQKMLSSYTGFLKLKGKINMLSKLFCNITQCLLVRYGDALNSTKRRLRLFGFKDDIQVKEDMEQPASQLFLQQARPHPGERLSQHLSIQTSFVHKTNVLFVPKSPSDERD